MAQDSVTPENLAGKQYYEIESISVMEYHPLPDGQGKPEQVHMVLDVAGIPYPLVVRFKTRRPVDELIVALIAHANNVWPKEVG
jgi:hypothetical protein